MRMGELSLVALRSELSAAERRKASEGDAAVSERDKWDGSVNLRSEAARLRGVKVEEKQEDEKTIEENAKGMGKALHSKRELGGAG